MQSALYVLLLDEILCDEREEKLDGTESTEERDLTPFSRDEKEEIKLLYNKLQKNMNNEEELDESSTLAKVHSLLSEKNGKTWKSI